MKYTYGISATNLKAGAVTLIAMTLGEAANLDIDADFIFADEAPKVARKLRQPTELRLMDEPGGTAKNLVTTYTEEIQPLSISDTTQLNLQSSLSIYHESMMLFGESEDDNPFGLDTRKRRKARRFFVSTK